MGVRGPAGNSSFLGEDLQGGLRDSFSDRSWHPLLDALNKCRQALHEGVCPALGLRLLDDRGAIVTSTPYLDDVGVSVCHIAPQNLTSTSEGAMDRLVRSSNADSRPHS